MVFGKSSFAVYLQLEFRKKICEQPSAHTNRVEVY